MPWNHLKWNKVHHAIYLFLISLFLLPVELHTKVIPRGLPGVPAHSLHHHRDNPAGLSLSLEEWFGVSPKFIWEYEGSINYQVFFFLILSLHKWLHFFSTNKQVLIKHDCPVKIKNFTHLKPVWTSFISQVGFAVFFSQRKIHKRSFGLLRIF